MASCRSFRPGAVGLSRAIRAWHAVPFDDRRTSHTLDRFAGLIGYRLVELAGIWTRGGRRGRAQGPRRISR